MSTPAPRKGKVLKVTRKIYDVALERRIIPCTVRGKVAAPDADYSAVKVGDNVLVTLVEQDEGVIEEILPRTSLLSRAIQSRAYSEHIVAVNIDQLLVILSAREPEFKSGLLDRYLVIAEKNGLEAVVCVNKIDLAGESGFGAYQEYYTAIGYPFYCTSALHRTGLQPVEDAMRERVTAIVGQSGVGKSSLLQAIEPGLDIRIGEISSSSRKGTHTTTHVELFPLSNDGFVIDTPGVRELGLWDIYQQELQKFYVDIRDRSGECQFGDCLHLAEPGCAVKQAVEAGEMLQERYENYVRIYESLRSASYEYAGSRNRGYHKSSR